MTASKRWPNLFIVGTARGGTSSLASTLGRHPDIFMSPLKEPYYFSDAKMRYQPFPKDEKAYLGLFVDAGDATWLGEGSTAYLWDPRAAERIRTASPEARIIISLRDPVARAYSGYWHAVGNGVETRPFPVVVEEELAEDPRAGQAPGHARAGQYLASVERYLSVFPGHVHVLFFEDLVRDPTAQIRNILGFLELGLSSLDTLTFESLNASRALRFARLRRILGSPRIRAISGLAPTWLQTGADSLMRAPVPPMPEETRRLLVQLYEAERVPLETLLGLSVSW